MKKKLVCIMISMLLFATVISVAGTEKLNDISNQTSSRDTDWWPMFQHDVSNSGYSSSIGPETGNTLWSWSKNAVSYTHTLASPVVVENKVIVPIVGNDRNDYLYCFDADNGDGLWSIQTEDDIDATPVVANGKVYVVSKAKIFCLDVETGEELWNKSSSGNLGSSPVYADGKLYYGSWLGIYCRDAEDGEIIWHYDNYEFLKSSPVVAEGRLYMASYFDELLICLDAEGNPETQTTTELWSFSTAGETPEFSSPTYANDRLYYSALNTLYCLDTTDNGSIIWQHPIQHASNENICPSYAYDHIYIGARYGEDGETMYCLDAIGNENGTTNVIWTFTEGLPYFLAAIADDKVYVCSGGDMTTTGIYCIDAHGNEDGTTDLIWFWNTEDSFPTHAVIIGDEKVYAIFWNSPMENRINSFIYCIGENEPPETPDIPTGPVKGVVGIEYSYETNEVIDPDEDIVQYKFDWGDGTDSGWLEEPSASKIWESDGTYDVTVIVTDGIFEVESEALDVTIADLVIKDIKGGLGVSAVVENIGETDIVAETMLKVNGGILGFINVTLSKTVEIPAGSEDELKTTKVFGLGKVTVTISAFGLEETRTGLVIGPIVIILPDTDSKDICKSNQEIITKETEIKKDMMDPPIAQRHFIIGIISEVERFPEYYKFRFRHGIDIQLEFSPQLAFLSGTEKNIARPVLGFVGNNFICGIYQVN